MTIRESLRVEWEMDADDFQDDPEEDITVTVGTSPMITVLGTGRFPCLDRDDADVMESAQDDVLAVARAIEAVPKMLGLIHDLSRMSDLSQTDELVGRAKAILSRFAFLADDEAKADA